MRSGHQLSLEEVLARREQRNYLILRQLGINLFDQSVIQMDRSFNSMSQGYQYVSETATNPALIEVNNFDQNYFSYDSEATIYIPQSRQAYNESQQNITEEIKDNIQMQELLRKIQSQRNYLQLAFRQKVQSENILLLQNIKLLDQMKQMRQKSQQYEKDILKLRHNIEELTTRYERRLQYYCKILDKNYKDKEVKENSLDYLNEFVCFSIKRLKFQLQEQRQLKQRQYSQKIGLLREIKGLNNLLQARQQELIQKERIVKQMINQIDITIQHINHRNYQKQSMTDAKRINNRILKFRGNHLINNEHFDQKQETRILKATIQQFHQQFDKISSILNRSKNRLNYNNPNLNYTQQQVERNVQYYQSSPFQHYQEEDDDIMSEISL